MAARAWPVWLSSVLFVAGCMPDRQTVPLVNANGRPPGAVAQLGSPRVPHKASPASQEAAMRVSLVGQRVLSKSREESGMRPVFHTVGVHEAEVFHRGPGEIFVTEGLVKQCQTDGQLAAVLAMEMGKMVAEREALAPPEARNPDKPPPQVVPVGGDAGGSFGPSDGTRLVELAKYDAERKAKKKPGTLPDPAVLAKRYLEMAGFTATDLDAAAPLLRTAGGNGNLERHILTGTPVPTRAGN